MHTDEAPFSGTTPTRHRGPVSFAKWCAVVGFFVGGAPVFCHGYGLARLPPLPPGQVYGTGDAFRSWSGVFLMVVVAPFAAILAAFVGFAVGTRVDDHRHERERMNPPRVRADPGVPARQDEER